MENLLEYVIEEALVLIPALLVLGKILKQTPSLQSWIIPYVLLVFGVGGAIAMLGLSPESVVQGVLVAGAAVFTHQLYRQAQKGDG